MNATEKKTCWKIVAAHIGKLGLTDGEIRMFTNNEGGNIDHAVYVDKLGHTRFDTFNGRLMSDGRYYHPAGDGYFEPLATIKVADLVKEKAMSTLKQVQARLAETAEATKPASDKQKQRIEQFLRSLGADEGQANDLAQVAYNWDFGFLIDLDREDRQFVTRLQKKLGKAKALDKQYNWIDIDYWKIAGKGIVVYFTGSGKFGGEDSERLLIIPDNKFTAMQRWVDNNYVEVED